MADPCCCAFGARLRELELIDDSEMAEIRSNESLLKRLKWGSEDAR